MIIEMKHIVISLTTILLALSGCQTKSEVAQVWDYIQERPDSALVVLNSIDASDLHGRTKAEYCLLKAMALDKNYVDVSSDSLALPSYLFFRKHGPKEKEMMSLYYMAVSRYYSHDDAEAVILLERVTDMAKTMGNNYYAGLGHILKSYAYSRTYCISEAVKSAELGVAAFEAIPDTLQVRRAQLQLADTYHAKKEFDKAIDLFQSLINSCHDDKYTMRRALIHCAYSMYLANPELADSSMHYYERAFRDYGARLDNVEAAHLGEVACKVGNTQLAHQILEQLKDSPRHPEQRAYLEYKLYKREGKPWKALSAVEGFHDSLDSVLVASLEQSLVKSQRNYQEQQKLSSEHALYLRTWIGIVCILCLILSLLVVMLYYSRKHRIESMEREQLISSVGETVKLLHESEQKNSDLVQSLETVQGRYIAAYKKQFSKISSIIASYYTSSGMKNSRDIVYKQVMDIAGTIGRDQTRMSVLERDVNSALDNAMKWYRVEFPGKNNSHYNMVCLFMAGFTTPMMEILTSTPRNTLYSKKSRLLDEIRDSSVEHKDLFLMVIR